MKKQKPEKKTTAPKTDDKPVYKTVCQNKKAFHDYFIEETIEAGVCLVGAEVKSLRQGQANLRDSYARVKDGEMFLIGAHISPYNQSDVFTRPDPDRTRKLLLKKDQIRRMIGKIAEKGFTLVATRIYFKNGKVKVELGLAKGKKLYDKRETLKERDVSREIAKATKVAK
ncbi:MAG: SsrA-binding protein SmpB [Deltaproteobacteria bacterium]|nr:SsrA-binding protein SmpB [Deltaproteobacteria bacterium]